jgi:hypothetical protein
MVVLPSSIGRPTLFSSFGSRAWARNLTGTLKAGVSRL